MYIPGEHPHLECCRDELYKDYIAALNSQVDKTLPLTEQIAQRFMITVQHYNKLQCCTKDARFPSKAAEIYYFKYIKPLFTSRLELYTLKFKGLLFAPVDPVDAVDYWRAETDRLELFRKQHADFIDYFEAGHTHKDDSYFVSSKISDVPTAWRTAYDVEDNYSSTHDGLIAGLLAHQQYHRFASRQLEMIMSTIAKTSLNQN